MPEQACTGCPDHDDLVVTAGRQSDHQEYPLNIRPSSRRAPSLRARFLALPLALGLGAVLSQSLSAREQSPNLAGSVAPSAGITVLAATAAPPAFGLPKAAADTTPEASAQRSNTRIDYSDGWWVPSESGWGMNVLHQGDVLALAFYVYDDTNTPIWYLGVANYIDENVGYRGTLSLHRGTPFLVAVFGPIQAGPTPIGTITFKPTSAYAANVNYTVGTTSIDKSMVRITFAPIDLNGTFLGGAIGTATGCAAGAGTVATEQLVATTATMANGQGQLLIVNSTGHCSISGALRQNGLLATLPNGTYSCTNGNFGVASIDEWSVNRNGMTARIRAQSGNCIEESRIAGARRP